MPGIEPLAAGSRSANANHCAMLSPRLLIFFHHLPENLFRVSRQLLQQLRRLFRIRIRIRLLSIRSPPLRLLQHPHEATSRQVRQATTFPGLAKSLLLKLYSLQCCTAGFFITFGLKILGSKPGPLNLAQCNWFHLSVPNRRTILRQYDGATDHLDPF